MGTSAGAIRRWGRVICYVFLLAALGGASQTSASTDKTESGKPKAKRVRFASPAGQPGSSADETPASAPGQPPPAQPLPQAYYSYYHTFYPQSSDPMHTPTNTTMVNPVGEVSTTEVRQQYAFAWQPVGVTPGAPAPFFAGTAPPPGAVPVRGHPGLYAFPEGSNATGLPVLNTMYPNTPYPFYIAAAPPSGQPTDLSQSTSSSTAPGVPGPYTSESQFQGFYKGNPGPAYGPFPRAPLAPGFVQPRGRRNPEEIMDEVRAQERLKSSSPVEQGRHQAVKDAVTKGLAVVGAVVAAKKAAQGLQTLYRMARGPPRVPAPPKDQ